MFEKLKAKIKTKYAHLGLSEKQIETYAKKLAKRVGEDETKIDAEVEDIEPDLELLQSQNDVIRGLKDTIEKSGKKSDDDKKDDNDKPDEKKQAPADAPEWAKSMIESNNKLAERLAEFENKEKSKTTQQILTEELKRLEVSEAYYSPFIAGREFKDQDEAKAYAQTLKDAESNYIQANNFKRLDAVAEDKPTNIFTKVSADGKTNELSDAEKAFVAKLAPKTEETAK